MKVRDTQNLSSSFFPWWKMIFVITAVMLVLPVLVGLTSVPNNPFGLQHRTGTIRSWNTTQKVGWLTTQDGLVRVQFAGEEAGVTIMVGCEITVIGLYEHNHPLGDTVFVADLMTVNRCPDRAVP